MQTFRVMNWIKTNKQQVTVLFWVNNENHNMLVDIDTNSDQEGNDKQFEKTSLIFQAALSVTDASFRQNKTFLSQYLLKASWHAK